MEPSRIDASAEMHGMTMQHRVHLLEDAQDAVGDMISHLSEVIWRERDKLQPDHVQIAQWEIEQRAFWEEQDALSADDPVALSAVLDKYNPIIRARYDAWKAAETTSGKMSA